MVEVGVAAVNTNSVVDTGQNGPFWLLYSLLLFIAQSVFIISQSTIE